MINCNGYIQIYFYQNNKVKTNKNYEEIGEQSKRGVKSQKEYKTPSKSKYKEIRRDNAMRSKLSLERLIKANADIFKTFITLTFAENVTDIDKANMKFNTWRTRIKRDNKEFKYICVPEYQKRGAVHYHLITNLDLNSNFISLQIT